MKLFCQNNCNMPFAKIAWMESRALCLRFSRGTRCSGECGAQRMTISCLPPSLSFFLSPSLSYTHTHTGTHTLTYLSFRRRPAIWIMSKVFQRLSNLRICDLPTSSNETTERWSYFTMDSVIWAGCALRTCCALQPGAAEILAPTPEDRGVKGAKKSPLSTLSLIWDLLQVCSWASPWEKYLEATITYE